jgi:AcrR family transcriptional regulator
MNVLLILAMGRIAGVTAAETRERLLLAAADVFAERGYDGTRVADIAAAAGVSNGALYAHFPSKAELMAGALRTHARRLLADVFAADPDRRTSASCWPWAARSSRRTGTGSTTQTGPHCSPAS